MLSSLFLAFWYHTCLGLPVSLPSSMWRRRLDALKLHNDQSFDVHVKGDENNRLQKMKKVGCTSENEENVM